MELTFSRFAILPDGTPLLEVIETTRTRRWFRTVEASRSVAYVLRAGSWWGEGNAPLSRRDPRHLKLCELAMRERINVSLDRAVG